MSSSSDPYAEFFTPDVYRDQLYTLQQSRLLTNIPRLTGSLSALGSSTIIYIILRDRKRKLQRVYHRLLLAYSCVDVVCSCNYALSALVVPKGTPGVYGAWGTVRTCEVSGFVTQFSWALGTYGSFICLYYVLVLRYRIREQTLARCVEPWVHAFALITPILAGILMWVFDMYNPTNVAVGWCFINVYPMDCLRRPEIEDLHCERGAMYKPWLILNNLPFFGMCGIVIVSCILTYLKVRSSEAKGSQWSFSSATAITRKQSSSPASARRLRETAIQAFLYIAAFFFTYIFFGIGTLFGPSPATRENRNFYFPISVLVKIFLPLQGFFSFFIYTRPRFQALRLRNPNLSVCSAFSMVLNSSEDAAAGVMGIAEEEDSNRKAWAAYLGRAAVRLFRNTVSNLQMELGSSTDLTTTNGTTTRPPQERSNQQQVGTIKSLEEAKQEEEEEFVEEVPSEDAIVMEADDYVPELDDRIMDSTANLDDNDEENAVQPPIEAD